MMSTFALAHRGREASAKADPSDIDLVAAVRLGDDRAFEELYRRYHARVTGYVARIVGDRQHGEEIAQEAFISALRRLRGSAQAIVFRPWIYGIARNAAIDHLRARSRRGTEVGIQHVEAVGGEPFGLVSSAPTPEDAVESKQAIRHLQGALGGLSEIHHQILVMRELEGLSYDQLGARLGMSRSQVESTLFRARRRLEEEYGELASGERCERVLAALTRRARLGVREERRIDRHLAHCPRCRREARRSRVAFAAA
jgi:RNA polymerase sigma factor (sigma-70 family)